MTQSQVRVLFFSKIAVLSEIIGSTFTDETEYNFEQIFELEELFDLIRHNFHGLVIIDLYNSVLELTSILEKKSFDNFDTPFIFMSENREVINQFDRHRFNSLEILFKPFRVNDLFHKILALMDSSKIFSGQIIYLRNAFFYHKTNEIRNIDGKSVRLTEKETEIIKFLYKQEGEITSKGVLLKTIWGYNEAISTHTLETHIYRLRKKLDRGFGKNELLLKNKNGYYLKI